MAAAWTAEEWERIERVARAERKERPRVSASQVSPQRRRIARAVADGAAMELRQWAQVAGGASTALLTPVPESLMEAQRL